MGVPSYLNEESSSLLRSEGDEHLVRNEPFCTPNRRNSSQFTIITLSCLVVVLSMVLLAVIMGPMCTDDTDAHSGDPVYGVSLDKYNTSRRSFSSITTPSQPSLEVTSSQPTAAGTTVKHQFGVISDIHLDLSIEECLHYNDSLYSYGIFGCDSSVALVNKALTSLSNTLEGTEQPFVLLLGDLVGHRASEAKTVNTIKVVFDMMDNTFPAVPVIPVLGNNDLPNKYQVPEAGWYEYLLPLYKATILKGAEVRLGLDFDKSFLHGGFYRAHLAHNVTVIALHTLLWYRSVPADKAAYGNSQLRWFQELMQGLGKDEKVIIIGHIPPGLSLYHLYKERQIRTFWTPRYTKIFARACHNYHDKIIGVFFGHTHEDSFRVENHWQAQLSMFIIPSLSPVYSGQPSFSVGTVDQARRLVDLVTHHTWLDYYSRVSEELKFKAVTSLAAITNSAQLSASTMKTIANRLIVEKDNQSTHVSLKNRWYQERFSPDLGPHLHYCLVTCLNGEDFTDCVKNFNFNINTFEKMY